MKDGAGISVGLGGAGPDHMGIDPVIVWPTVSISADQAWREPLLKGIRVWAMAAVAGLCPLRIVSTHLVGAGLAAWVVPLDRFMRALCAAAPRPLQVAPPDCSRSLRDEAHVLKAFEAIRSRRSASAREQLCAVVAPDCLDDVLHAALMLGACLQAGAAGRSSSEVAA